MTCQRISLQVSSKKGQWTYHTNQWFRLQLAESNNCKQAIVFPAFFGLSVSYYTAWYSGTDYAVAFRKGIHNCRVPYKAPVPVLRIQGQTIRPSSIRRQVNGLQGRGETNARQ